MRTKSTTLPIYALFVLLLVTATACERAPDERRGEIPLSDGLKKAMGEYKARTAILVNDQGETVATDDQGRVLERCSIKPLDKGDLKNCRGLEKGAVVTNVKTVVLIKSTINPQCWVIPDEYGRAQEYCW